MKPQQNNTDDMGDFHGANINFAHEYHTIRKMMGQCSTDLDELHHNTTLLYFNAPDKWKQPYLSLIDEITMRHDMIKEPYLTLIDEINRLED